MCKMNIVSTSKCKKKKQESSPQAKTTVSKTRRNSGSVSATKNRSKTRKPPKYMSLKLELITSSTTSNRNNNNTASDRKNPKTQQRKKQQRPKKQNKKQNKDKTNNNKMPPKQEQLNLFPLHPENLNKLDMQELEQNQVALLFETADDASTTLNSLLDTTPTTTTTTTTTRTEERDPLSCSSSPRLMTYMYKERCCLLEKTAMRCKERDPSEEERWVSYCEVVMESSSISSSNISRRKKRDLVQEEVSSNNHNHYNNGNNYDFVNGDYGFGGGSKNGLVGLKLDNYQEILNAWATKGSLYIDGDGGDLQLPQTVPLLHDPDLSNAFDSLGNLWTVPEMEGNKEVKGKILKDSEGGLNLGNRQASLLRYREKRQSRLYSKRIRYEVRKLNAEKRPRLKGRFVRRTEEEDDEE